MHRSGIDLCAKVRRRWTLGWLIPGCLILTMGGNAMSEDQKTREIRLPAAFHRGAVSLEQTLSTRRSVREYSDQPLTLAQISQLLWAAQGMTHPGGFRTAPSAGALYPLAIYLIAGKVGGLEAGIYQYVPHRHALAVKALGEKRSALSQAALQQRAVSQAPATILLAAVYARTTGRYGERGKRYVHMEAGHVAQNVALQAVSLGLGAVFIGAFQDDLVQQAAGLPAPQAPLYLIPIGR
jgi:SagB-type dehydrogenase family enzyme